MKKISLYLLFLSFVSVLQAQIIPTSSGTSTSDVGGVIQIGIAAPNSSGLSNNTYSDFNISSSGIILNNSGSASTSQLTGGNIAGNSNITTGSEASLILNQVTSNSSSLLEGKTEVVGTKAGVIIANPNGITCSGCGFINASKVEFITGAIQSDGSFNIDSSEKITISGTGLDGSGLDYLNLVSRYHDIQAQITAKTKLRILSGNVAYTSNTDNDSTLSSDTTSSYGYAVNISSLGNLQAGSIEIIGTEAGLGINTQGNLTSLLGEIEIDVAGDFTNNGGITADSFNVTAGNNFYNVDGATINANDFNVTAGNHFYNTNGFNVEEGGDLNDGIATINADNFNVTAGNNFYNDEDAIINANNFNATAGDDFFNWYGATIHTNNFNVTAGDRFYNRDNATINADNFNVVTRYDFYNYNNATINANNFNATAGEEFYNYATIEADSLTISADSLINTHSYYGDGNITADKLTLSLIGDFDYANDFQNNGNIDATILNFQVGGDFSYDDANNDFVWNASDSLVVLGSASITADNYTQSGAIDIAGDLSIQVTIEASLDDTASIQSRNLFFSAYDFYNQADFTVTDNATFDIGNDFGNGFDLNGAQYYGGNISAGNFNVITGRYFYNSYSATINADNFNVTAGDDFYNQYSATIHTNNFNVTAGVFSNDSATIDANDFNVTAGGWFENLEGATINADSFNVIAGDDFDNSVSATINANNFNVTAGVFSNDSATINANNFNVTAGDDFFNSDNATINVNNFNVTAGDDFYNQYNSTINANYVTISADSFDNTHTLGDGNISADSFALSVEGDFDYTKKGTITTNTFNLNVGGDFSNNDSANDFTWGANDALTVSGSASIDAADFKNNGVFNVGDLNITAAGDFDNYATIDAENFNVTVVNNFNNRSYATINADSFNVTTDSFFNETNSTITANECNIIYTTLYSDLGTITCNDEDEIEVIDIARPDANGLSNNSYTDFNILNSGIVLNNSDSAGTSQLAGSISANTNYNSGDAASLILAQITGNDISLLEGALEVFGAEAGVIIANPSGITCNGCSFINASRVDLVTGSNYNVATDTFDSIANTNIALIDNGFDASSVGILNIQAGSFTNAGGLNANIFNLSVAGDFDYTNRGTITTTGFNLNVGGDFSNNDAANDFTWGAQNSLTVLGNASFNVDDFYNKGRIDVANNFNVIAGDDFFNTQNATISANNFSVLTQDRFYNLHNATISVNDFNVTAGSLFANRYDANISANDFNVTAADNFYNTDSATISANDLTISANSFVNTHTRGDGNINADTLTLSLIGDFDYATDYLGNGNINATNLNFQVGGDFSYDDARKSFVWDANSSLVVLGSASFNIYDFFNRGKIDVANDFNVRTDDDFFNTQNATINADNFNVFIRDSFYNMDSATINANDFNVTNVYFHNMYGATINANDFNVTSVSFHNIRNATINANDLTISANSFVNTYPREDGNINADTLTLSLIGDFDYATDYLGNGNINASNLNFQVGGDFSYNDTNSNFVWHANNSLVVLGNASFKILDFYNKGKIDVVNNFNVRARDDFFNVQNATIIANNFNVLTQDRFYNLHSATINANDFNVTAGSLFANRYDAKINANGFNVTAADNFYNTDNSTISANDISIFASSFINSHTRGDGNINADTLNISLIGDFDYVSDFGNIGATTLNFQVGGDFSYSDINSNFVWDTNNSLVVLGSASFNVNDFLNKGKIDVANDLTISADSFVNTHTRGDGNINADTLSISLIGDFEYESGYQNNGNINVTNQNFIIDGDFSKNHHSDIILTGDLGIIADNFISTGGNIVVNNFNVTSRYNFNNLGKIYVLNNFNTTVTKDFYNWLGSTINATNFNVIAGDSFYNQNLASINADSFNVTAKNLFANQHNAIINVNDFNIIAGDNFYNIDSAVIIANDITISADSFVNTHAGGDGNINADNTVSLYVAGDFDYAKDFQNNGNIDATNQNFIIGGDFTNNTDITLLGNLGITANRFISYGGSIVVNDFDVTSKGLFTNRHSAKIDVDNFNVTAGGRFFNTVGSTIIADNFNVSAGDYFSNARNSKISADNFNVISGGRFYNLYSAKIDVDNFNVTAGDFFSNARNSKIDADNFDVTVGYYFANVRNAQINADNFNVTAQDRFYSLYGSTINANDLTISASVFVNTHPNGGGNINADTLTLSLTEGFDYTSDYLNNGNINAATLTILEDE